MTTITAPDFSLLTSRPMPAAMRRRLERLYCRRERVSLWGQYRGTVKHMLLPFVWGDGKVIVALRPICTSLGHYVVALDSTCGDGRHGLRFDLHDLMEQVEEIVEEQFGICHCEQCDEEYEELYGQESYGKYNIFKEWPTPCYSVGCQWWRLK